MDKQIASYKNFHEFWLDKVSNVGSHVCITDGEDLSRKFTFAQINDYVDRTAYLLCENGIKKNDRFIVFSENHPEFFFLYLASLKLGTLIVPVNPYLLETEVLSIIDIFKPILIFADSKRMPLAKKCQDARKSFIKKSFCLDSDAEDSPRLINVLSSIGKVNISYNHVTLSDHGSLYCSSGTTGQPKGIPQSPLNLLTAAKSLFHAYGFGPHDTQIGILPVYHTALVTYGFWPGVFAGSSFILCRKFSRQRFWKDIEGHKAAFVETVPAILSMLMNPGEDISKYDLSSLKFIGSGSAPLSLSLWKNFEAIFNVRISNKYGLSETAPTHFNPPWPVARKMGSIGKALDMCKVKIVNRNDSEKECGEIGELVMQGDNVVRGYFEAPEESSTAFRDGWFHSGDLGYKDADGFFFLVGRRKEIIIRGGINIYPIEIDNVLSSHPNVVEAVTFGMPHKIYGEEVYAAVKLRAETVLDGEELISYCQKYLAHHKCPKRIFITDKIPRTPSGKPLRKELYTLYKSE